jgi:hypothetical protein
MDLSTTQAMCHSVVSSFRRVFSGFEGDSDGFELLEARELARGVRSGLCGLASAHLVDDSSRGDCRMNIVE